jgi:hypothetical protein
LKNFLEFAKDLEKDGKQNDKSESGSKGRRKGSKGSSKRSKKAQQAREALEQNKDIVISKAEAIKDKIRYLFGSFYSETTSFAYCPPL